MSLFPLAWERSKVAILGFLINSKMSKIKMNPAANDHWGSNTFLFNNFLNSFPNNWYFHNYFLVHTEATSGHSIGL